MPVPARNRLLLALLGSLFLTPAASAAVQGQPEPFWTYSLFGTAIGESNIVIAENLPTPEIYLGASTITFGSNDYWYALRWDVTSQEYVQTFISPFFPVAIRRIALGDVLPTPGLEIVVAQENGELVFYRQLDKLEIGRLQTSANVLTGMYLYDLDGNGLEEIAVCTSDHLYVYDGSGATLADLPGIGGSDVIAGQMDGDAGPEIVTTDGTVVDAATTTVQCSRSSGFGFTLEASDFDGDGMEELVFADGWAFCQAFEVDTCQSKWSISLPTLTAIRCADVDGDGVDELLVAEGSLWNRILGYDMRNLGQLWSIDSPVLGMTDVAAGDVDGDGLREVLWGAGATNTGPDHLFIADWTIQLIEWQSVHLDGPFIGPELGDVDGDGRDELVAISKWANAKTDAGRIVVFDDSLQLLAISPEVARSIGWVGVHDLKLRDVDADGSQEILIGTSAAYDGLIEIYDFSRSGGFSLSWDNNVLPQSTSFYSVQAADVDGDGQMEILGGSGPATTGTPNTSIFVYDYATGNEEWMSPQMGNGWDAVTALAVEDVDLDGSLEMVGMTGGGAVHIYDGPSKTLESTILGSFTCLRTAAATPGAPPFLVLGNDAGYLSVYQNHAGSYPLLAAWPLASGAMDGFTLGPWSSVWVSSGGSLSVHRPLHTPNALWQSDGYGTVFGQRTVFLPQLRAFVTGGSYSLIGFRAN